jgi:type I restriction enzyme S subunit
MNKSKVLGNEIIMSKIGNAGKVYLMPKINRPTSLAMNLFLIRVDENNALPEFIFRFLKSNKGESQILKRVKGATTKTITKDNVRNIIILYPPLEKQKQIVRKLEALTVECKKLEAIYIQKIAELDELKKSVLQKAFRGELI